MVVAGPAGPAVGAEAGAVAGAVAVVAADAAAAVLAPLLLAACLPPRPPLPPRVFVAPRLFVTPPVFFPPPFLGAGFLAAGFLVGFFAGRPGVFLPRPAPDPGFGPGFGPGFFLVLVCGAGTEASISSISRVGGFDTLLLLVLYTIVLLLLYHVQRRCLRVTVVLVGDDGGDGPGTGNTSTLLLRWKRRRVSGVLEDCNSSTGISTMGLRERAEMLSMSAVERFRKSE